MESTKLGYITKRDFVGEHGYRDLIKGFEEKQLTPVGYDFRAGKCINLTLGERVELTEGVTYPIRHGDFVIVVTRETLHLSGRDDIFGQVFSKVSFAIQGLSHVGTKIDPGFEGPLVLSFKNEGYDIIEFGWETAVCNVALQVIPSTDAIYGRQSFNYPTLTERPQLPFPLSLENWEKLSRWYSKEAFDSYLQWSDQLSKLREFTLTQRAELEAGLALKLDESRKHQTQTDNQNAEFRNTIDARIQALDEMVKEKTDRADRIYGGAVLTIFIATIAVIGVLISAAALFANELGVKVQGEGLPVSRTFLYICGAVSLAVVWALWNLLRKK
jgi:deoxycytidine triphosphate deaminase